ncbi:MAG: 4-hydroxy-tetrahydrodipicolinate reductase [Bacteroidota bacterium]|nr:4-hydroxy-tetrahydrodipicolinate reductase [Bacteroidota bacterium]MDX5447648.1 4-hydroxy-tetrahydrodipicolinate reductase [Bacteroidota bacterium]MDX5506339.1 4-hydroxy-tetrahydrodipicolinate reductase [Bacteroidota bacterium]
MNIALIGYGKMGKAIEGLAKDRGHTIVLRTNRSGFQDEDLQGADVAIEFTSPEAGYENIMKCVRSGVPVVCGTTGWLDHWENAVKAVEKHKGTLFYASNYSLGVNLFFALNKKLARLMDPFDNYDVQMTEIHHTQKKDAPSGTAITLAEGILENLRRKSDWTLDAPPSSDQILIDAKRIDPTPGTHIVEYTSDIDSIEIKHTAHSRKGFALGALIAAEWINGKQGVYGMKDMLNL